MSTNKTLGRLNSLGIAKEVTRGTTPASAGFFISFDEASIEEKDLKILNNQSNGVIEDSVGMDIVKQWSEGTWKAPVTDKHFGLILLAILGVDTPALHPTETTVYDHVVTVAQNVQSQSLSLYLKDSAATAGAQDYTYALGTIHSLELAYEAGKYIEYTAGIKAKKGVQTAVTVAAIAENRFLPQDVTIELAANLAGLTGATATKVKSLKMKFDDKSEDDQVLGDITPNDYLSKEFSIEGTIEATWDSEATFKTATLAGTTQAMRIDLANSRVTIGTSAHPEIIIDLAKVTFKELTRPWKIGDIVRQTLQFKAHYSVGDTCMIKATVTNATATY
jgi:hypothetical protein